MQIAKLNEQSTITYEHLTGRRSVKSSRSETETLFFFKLYLYLSACGRGFINSNKLYRRCLLTILAYIKNYNPKLLALIIIIRGQDIKF